MEESRREKEIRRMSLGRNINDMSRDTWIELNGLWWRSIILGTRPGKHLPEYNRFKKAIHDETSWEEYAREAESTYDIGGMLDAYAAGVSIDDITA